MNAMTEFCVPTAQPTGTVAVAVYRIGDKVKIGTFTDATEALKEISYFVESLIWSEVTGRLSKCSLAVLRDWLEEEGVEDVSIDLVASSPIWTRAQTNSAAQADRTQAFFAA